MTEASKSAAPPPSAGPWAVNEFIDLDGDRHIQVCVESSGAPVANLVENGAETRANARLIKVAPELLEKLGQLLSEYQRFIPDHRYDSQLVKGAQAVIAAANGGQHD